METKTISESSNGYLSEKDKQKYTITAGIIAALFFIGQFIVPFIMMIIIMPAMIMFQTDFMKISDFSKAVECGGNIWYFETSIGPSGASDSNLKKLNISDLNSEAELVTKIKTADPSLLSDGEKLWIISSNQVSVLQNGKITSDIETNYLGDISKPFLFKSKPAVLESTPDKLELLIFNGNEWDVEKNLTYLQEEYSFDVTDIKILTDSGNLHLFREYGGTVYYMSGFPEKGTDEDCWQPVGKISHEWYPVLLGGMPALFIPRHNKGALESLEAVRLKEGKWEKFFHEDSLIITSLAVFPEKQPDVFVLAIQSMPFSLKLQKVENGKVTETVKHGSGFPFPSGMMAMMFIPHLFQFLFPLLLAVTLSAFMKKHRVCIFRSGESKMYFASLTKRAFSQIIDSIVLLAPMGTAYLLMFSMFFDFEEMFKMMTGGKIFIFLGLMMFGFFWIILCFVLFSILEGKYGITPGKWVMGIRVLGTDMKPCGIGRGFIRNILKIVDGFFNFMIGIMIVAYTENWQRLGDMAARTVVLDKRKLK